MTSSPPSQRDDGLGKARIAALEWLALRGPVAWFGKDTPNMQTVKWLRNNGYAETTKSGERFSQTMPFDVTAYQISDAGRAVLAARAAKGRE